MPILTAFGPVQGRLGKKGGKFPTRKDQAESSAETTSTRGSAEKRDSQGAEKTCQGGRREGEERYVIGQYLCPTILFGPDTGKNCAETGAGDKRRPMRRANRQISE